MNSNKIQKTEEEWKKELTPEQYKIMREKGTEAPFTGKYLNTKDAGMFKCAACGNPLFLSETKFESGTGWPSFADVIDKGNVELREDVSGGMARTEVVCAKCGAHLGHVFEDGPTTGSAGKPTSTGKRYCINSVCLDFEKRE